MRKAEWGTMTNTCSVCRGPGHNRRSCPEVPKFAKECKEIMDSGIVITRIDKHLVSAYEENELRKHRKKKKPTKDRKCSFCKVVKHTKRNCPAKAKYRDLLYEANRCWRRGMLEDMEKAGFGAGALIKINQSGGIAGLKPKTSPEVGKVTYAIVSAIPWEKMTFMGKYTGRWEYQTDYNFQATTTCGYAFRMSESELRVLLKTNKFHINNNWSIPRGFLTIASPATPGPPEDWLAKDSKVAQVEWLINDHSASQLEDYGIISLARKIIKLFP